MGLFYQATSSLGLGWRKTLEEVGLAPPRVMMLGPSDDVRSCFQLSFQDIQMLGSSENPLWSFCVPKVHQSLLSVVGVFIAQGFRFFFFFP